MKFLVSHLILLLAWITSGLALDEEPAKERRCIDSKVDPNVNNTWIASVQKWHYPILSKLELYRTASDILEQPVSEISPRLVKSPCILCNAQLKCTGYERTSPIGILSVDDAGVSTFKSESKYAKTGTNTIVFTDNKSLVISIICWEDNEAAYEVWSTTPKISDTNRKIALDFLKKLGFSMGFMVESSYEHCPLVNSAPKTMKPHTKYGVRRRKFPTRTEK